MRLLYQYISQAKSDPNNYRPISILPTISKIIERHVATQLFDYLKKKHNLLYANQSGFREYPLCCTALLKLTRGLLTLMMESV